MRWTPTRKAALCQAILRGAASFEAVALSYSLSEAELRGWLDRFRSRGVAGLYISRPQGPP